MSSQYLTCCRCSFLTRLLFVFSGRRSETTNRCRPRCSGSRSEPERCWRSGRWRGGATGRARGETRAHRDPQPDGSDLRTRLNSSNWGRNPRIWRSCWPAELWFWSGTCGPGPRTSAEILGRSRTSGSPEPEGSVWTRFFPEPEQNSVVFKCYYYLFIAPAAMLVRLRRPCWSVGSFLWNGSAAGPRPGPTLIKDVYSSGTGRRRPSCVQSFMSWGGNFCFNVCCRIRGTVYEQNPKQNPDQN